MSTLLNLQEEKQKIIAKGRVSKGIDFIKTMFGHSNLQNIDETVDIGSGWNCALSRACHLTYADAVTANGLAEQAISLGFVGDENCPGPALTNEWRRRASEWQIRPHR